jgi:2-oxoglutarate ferredoxin oxidoreductase subunit beta
MFDPLMSNPENLIMLTHKNGMQMSDALKKVYKNIEEHDPSEMLQANYYANMTDKMPVGILYKNENVPCYEELRKPERAVTPKLKQEALEQEFDKFGIMPTE